MPVRPVSWLAVSFLAVASLVPSVFLVAFAPLAPARARADGDRVLFTFKDKRITESSGLTVSPTHDGIVYTHNDSGDGPRFFAVGLDGRTRATFTVAGAVARDWEAMASSVDPQTGRGVLWIADIGDNLEGAWPDVSIYKIMEPRTIASATLPATRYRFRYENGARNAEGMMVDPRSGRVYIVSKEFSGSVYRAPAKLRADRVNILRRVGEAPIMATDAAYAPDGSSFVIRTYFSATVYRSPGQVIAHVTMPALRQAESIAYTRDGKALLTGSEGAGSPVYEVPLPAEARAHPSPSAAAESAQPAEDPRPRTAKPVATPHPAAASREADDGLPVSMIALWVGVAVGAIGIISFIAWRTAR